MAVLYVSEQGAVLRKDGERVILQKDGVVLGNVPCLELDTVLLFGNVQVTTQALGEMLEHGIEIALLSRSGKLHGQITPPKAKNIVLRLRQYKISPRSPRLKGRYMPELLLSLRRAASVYFRSPLSSSFAGRSSAKRSGNSFSRLA